jgi:hypothetical protein
MKPSVFTNSELGMRCQKLWLKEFQTVLTENYEKMKSDYILVVPNSPMNSIARVTLMNLNDPMPFKELMDDINRYVIKSKAQGLMVVVFINQEGRINYYTIYKTKKYQ